MSKCRENQENNKPCPSTSKPKTKKQFCCIREYNQLKNNLKTLQTLTQISADKQSTSNKSKTRIMDSQKRRSNTPCDSSQNKTWFQVLQESPKKETSKRTSNTDERHQRTCNRPNVPDSNNPQTLTLSLDDEKFLKTLIRMNDLIQAECDDARKATRTHANISITDDDKFKTYMGRKLQEQSEDQREKQNLQAKALAKLLQNMQAVSENSEVQRQTLENLTRQVAQLREENKMLDKLKEVRIDLESKLASLSTENIYLKKRLQSVEMERDKANHLLDARDKEINLLKKHIAEIKGKIANKIDSGIKYDLEDPPFEFDLEETLPDLPSKNQSFDSPIRPASSSPTEGVLQKWKNKSPETRPKEKDGAKLPVQENHKPTDNAKAEASIRTRVLTDLKNNVKKTVEEFELDMNFDDEALNLSDTTYRIEAPVELNF